MPFNWEEYLNLAKQLAGNECAVNSEAKYRASVSRAYFAAHCYARNAATEKLGFRSTGFADDHQNLINHFRNHGKAQKVGDLLKDLRYWRNDADYHESKVVDQLLADNAVRTAQKVFEFLRANYQAK